LNCFTNIHQLKPHKIFVRLEAIERKDIRLYEMNFMSLEEYVSSPLWSVLVETVHSMILYPHHKAYTRDVILHEQPDVSPSDLASKLGVSLGEAFVIFYELKKQKSES
jgi:hypothetical protein